ncbi:MAG: carboxypeptidase-like regulatory domain-containing protein, partial [Bacteroidota bacterium]
MRILSHGKDAFARYAPPLTSTLLLFFLLLTTTALSAQNRVSGKVVDEDDTPLIGVTVLQTGTTNGTVTDLDGNYTLGLIDGERSIRFSYTGFTTQVVEAGNQTVLNVSLAPDAETLEEVVVVGYGTERKRDVLGSIGSIKTEDIAQNTPVSAFDAIQGRLSGVQITANGGPGEGSDIRIRGTSTLSGGVGPLYVVDGQQLDNIDNLDPNSIASIE